MKVVVKQHIINKMPSLVYSIELDKPYYEYKHSRSTSFNAEHRKIECVTIQYAVDKLKDLILKYNWDTRWLVKLCKSTINFRYLKPELNIIKELEFDITPLSIGDSIMIDGNTYTIDKLGYNSEGYYEIIVLEIKYIKLDHNYDLEKETELLRTEVNKVLDEIRVEREKAMVNEEIGKIVNEKENKTIIYKIKEFIDGIRHSRRNRR